jgi:predicted transcriptional regulator
MDKQALLTLTSDIVASHASANELSQGELLEEIVQVFRKLASLEGTEGLETSIAVELPPDEEAENTPAVPLEAAFGAEKVFCMACGKGMKTLKRHLSTAHDLKPGQYRRKFGIPPGTPLVAKNYSKARKKMAEDLNLAAGLAKARAARGKKKKR